MVKVEVGMRLVVKFTLGGEAKEDACEVLKINKAKKSSYCYVKRDTLGWLGVQFSIGDAWPLRSRPEKLGYTLHLPEEQNAKAA